VPKYLLDSSFLIDYFNEKEAGAAGPALRFRRQLPQNVRFYGSIVSLAELVEGAEDTEEASRRFYQAVTCIGLFQQHGWRAGLLQKQGREQGRRIGENDAWIAATAALAHLTLVGDDDAAFADRPGVNYVNFRRN